MCLKILVFALTAPWLALIDHRFCELHPAAHTMFRTSVCVLLFGAPLLLVGCGEPKGLIEGKVLNQGDPVPYARLVLRPVAAEGRSFRGETVGDGTYYFEETAKYGIPPGDYRVNVTYHTMPNGNPPPSGEEGESLRRDGKLRKREVAIDVQIEVGSHPFDFEVTNGEVVKKGAD